jgi:hypothetical protein
MPSRKPYKRVEENGIEFLFKYDDDAPELLHIYARHVTDIDDALDTFFGGQTTWNAQFERFETFTQTHGLFWFWLEEKKRVMVISCFKV